MKIDKYKAGPGRPMERIPPGKMAFSTKARFMEMREYNDFPTNKFSYNELSNRSANYPATSAKKVLSVEQAD